MYRLFLIVLLALTPEAFSFSIYSDYNLRHLSREERYAFYDCAAGDLGTEQCQVLLTKVCEANTNLYSSFCVDQYFKKCATNDFEGEFCQKKLELACTLDLDWNKKCESFRYDKCKAEDFEGNLRFVHPLTQRETVKACKQIRLETFINLLSDEVTKVEQNMLGGLPIKDKRYDTIVDEAFWKLAKSDMTSPFAGRGKNLCGTYLGNRNNPEMLPLVEPLAKYCDQLCALNKNNPTDPIYKEYNIYCTDYAAPGAEVATICGDIAGTIGDHPNLLTVLGVRTYLKKHKADVKCFDFLYKKAAKDGVMGAPGSWDQVVAMDIYLRDKIGRNGRDLKMGLTRFLARFGADDHTTLFFLISDFLKADRETKIAILERMGSMTTRSGVATLLLYQQMYGSDKEFRAKAMEAFAARWRNEFDYSYVADVGTEVSTVLLPCTGELKSSDIEIFQNKPDIKALAAGNLEEQFCKLGVGLNLRDQIRAIYNEIYFPALEGSFGKEAQLASLRSIQLLTNTEDKPRLLTTLDRLAAASNTSFDVKTAIYTLLIGLNENDRAANLLDVELRNAIKAGTEDFDRLGTLLTLVSRLPTAFSIRTPGVETWSFTKGTYFDYLILCAQNGSLSARFKNFCFDEGIDIAFANAPTSSRATDKFFDRSFYQLAGERLVKGRFADQEATLKRVLSRMNFTKNPDTFSQNIRTYFADIGLEKMKAIFASRFENEPFLFEDYSRLARLNQDSGLKLDQFLKRIENKNMVRDYLTRSWGTFDFKGLLENDTDLIKKNTFKSEINGEPFATSYYRFVPELVFGTWTPDVPWKLENVLAQGFVTCENDPNRTWPDACARVPWDATQRRGQIKWESMKRTALEHIFKSDDKEIKKYGLFTTLLSLYRVQEGFPANEPVINPYSLSWGIYGSSDTEYSFTRPTPPPAQQ